MYSRKNAAILTPTIRVKHSGVVRLLARKDPRRGNLFVAEAGKNIPFPIRRVFFVNAVKGAAVRGGHAHKKLKQVIVCANGSFTLTVDDGRQKQAVRMNDPSLGIVLGPKLWHTMSGFSKDCVMMVFGSDHYKESDYIRDYEEFLKATS